jgi:hypothetical protein
MEWRDETRRRELVTRGLEDAVDILTSIGGADADPVIIVPL